MCKRDQLLQSRVSQEVWSQLEIIDWTVLEVDRMITF